MRSQVAKTASVGICDPGAQKQSEVARVGLYL